MSNILKIWILQAEPIGHLLCERHSHHADEGGHHPGDDAGDRSLVGGQFFQRLALRQECSQQADAQAEQKADRRGQAVQRDPGLAGEKQGEYHVAPRRGWTRCRR